MHAIPKFHSKLDIHACNSKIPLKARLHHACFLENFEEIFVKLLLQYQWKLTPKGIYEYKKRFRY